MSSYTAVLDGNIWAAKYTMAELERIRQRVVAREPFIAVRAFKARMFVCTSINGMVINTAATDGTDIYVNPDWFQDHTIEQQMFILAHELFHGVMGHSLRRGKRRQDIWNAAADYEVNGLLVKHGYTMPDSGLFDKKYENWHAERVYEYIKDDFPSEDPDGDGDGGSGTGEASSGSSSGGGYGTETGTAVAGTPQQDDDSSNTPHIEGAEDDERSDTSANGDKENPTDPVDSGQNDESEGSGSDAEPKGSLRDKYGQSGEVMDALNPDGSEMTESDRQTALIELGQDNAIAKLCEIASGNAQKVTQSVSIDRLSKPRNTWKQELRKWFNKKGTPCGTTWRKLKRRAIANKLYAPSRKHQGIEWAVFAYDMSLSMDMRALEALNVNMEEIRKSCSMKRITILPFNSDILTSQIRELKGNEKIPTDWKSGGGTDFACIFDWVRRQRGTPDVVMIFTDLGDRNYGEPVKGSDTLWVSSEPVYSWGSGDSVYTNKPPFGGLIEIDVSQ